MTKLLIVGAGLLGIGLLLAVFLVIGGIGFHNQEVTLRNTITAKQTDNKNEMDSMWKIIEQSAQVTTAQKEALVEIFSGYAEARSGKGDGGSLMKWIQESCPNVAGVPETYNKLMNVITSQREGFKFRQKELLDYKREHDNLLTKFPGVIYAWVLGRNKIDVVIVTSSRTENAFKSGKDDDTDLFKKK